MTPRNQVRAAYVLIPLSVVLAVVGVVLANWVEVIGMALVCALQVANLRLARRRL